MIESQHQFVSTFFFCLIDFQFFLLTIDYSMCIFSVFNSFTDYPYQPKVVKLSLMIEFYELYQKINMIFWQEVCE